MKGYEFEFVRSTATYLMERLVADDDYWGSIEYNNLSDVYFDTCARMLGLESVDDLNIHPKSSADEAIFDAFKQVKAEWFGEGVEWNVAKHKPHDSSGVNAPHLYRWENINGVYYPKQERSRYV